MDPKKGKSCVKEVSFLKSWTEFEVEPHFLPDFEESPEDYAKRVSSADRSACSSNQLSNSKMNTQSNSIESRNLGQSHSLGQSQNHTQSQDGSQSQSQEEPPPGQSQEALGQSTGESSISQSQNHASSTNMDSGE